MPLIAISRDSSGKLVFEPASVTLDASGDFVSWANHDPTGPHQPTLQGQATDYWLDDPLPAYVDGQPAATSPVVALTPLSGQENYPPCPGVLGAVCVTYVDGLNPGEGSGTIRIPLGTPNAQGGTQ